MPADKWIETYRGTVFRWEVDDNDHFTVAYYLARIADASVAMLHGLGTGPAPTVDCFIRYQKELRVGDVMHIESAVIAVDGDGIVLGHKLYESAAGDLCTTIEQRVRVRLDPRTRVVPTVGHSSDRARAATASTGGATTPRAVPRTASVATPSLTTTCA